MGEPLSPLKLEKVRETVALANERKAYAALKTVAVLTFDGVEFKAFASPAEIFGVGAREKAFQIVTVAVDKRLLKMMRGIMTTPQYSYSDAPRAGNVVVPGGNPRAVREDGRKWIVTTLPGRSTQTSRD